MCSIANGDRLSVMSNAEQLMAGAARQLALSAAGAARQLALSAASAVRQLALSENVVLIFKVSRELSRLSGLSGKYGKSTTETLGLCKVKQTCTNTNIFKQSVP